MNIAHVIINEHGAIFAELIELLADCLRRLGLSPRRSVNRLSTEDMNLLVGHTAFLSPANYAAIRGAARPYVVFQVEALDPSHGFAPEHSAYLDFLRGARQVWDYAPGNVPFLEALGCRDTAYVPIGYAPVLERIVPAPVKDIDVLFYGAIRARRQHVLERLRERGIDVRVLFGAYGPARDREIARAKIVLNMHQFETAQLEQIRLAYLLNNRCFVVSETADGNPYGEGLVFCDYDRLADCCADYLRPGMEAERERIALAGHAALQVVPTLDAIRDALSRLRASGDLAG